MPDQNQIDSISTGEGEVSKNETNASNSGAGISSSLNSIRESLGSGDKKAAMKKYKLIVLGVVLAAGIIFGAIYLFGGIGGIKSPLGGTGSLLQGSPVMNPLTGEMVSGRAASEWKDIRPLAVMVNNHVDARPQSGLIYADVVYEIVAEGGITRMLPFYLGTVPEKIGPVRSTREYYLVLVKELGDAMLMHIGWSPQALEAIENWPVRSLGRGGGTFWRDSSLDVAIEHTAYVDGKDLVKIALDLGWGGTREFQVWKFKDDPSVYDSESSASHVEIDFWTRGEYSAIFDYDAESNTYLRSMGYDDSGNPVAHADRETSEQIRVANLIVQFVAETPIIGDDSGRLEYEFVGSGTGLVFVDGKVVQATWTKEDRDGRTLFYDLNGEEIQFNRGKFWVSVVPDRNVSQVVYN